MSNGFLYLFLGIHVTLVGGHTGTNYQVTVDAKNTLAGLTPTSANHLVLQGLLK